MGVKNLIRNAKPLKENMQREKSVFKNFPRDIGKHIDLTTTATMLLHRTTTLLLVLLLFLKKLTVLFSSLRCQAREFIATTAATVTRTAKTNHFQF